MMKKIIGVTVAIFLFASCSNKKKENESPGTTDNKVALHSDTLNMVKLTDTMVIYESTCRGCAYEQSTHFDISDSMGLVKLEKIITTDNNSPDMNGGNISKQLVLVPVKTGKTIIKMYKFWKEPATPEDSIKFVPYIIEIKN